MSGAVDSSAAKELSTLQAKAALAGWEVKPGTGEGGRPAFFVTRWGFTRELGNLDAVRTFLHVVGAIA